MPNGLRAPELAAAHEAALSYEDYLATDPERAQRWIELANDVRLTPEQTALVEGFTRRMPVLCISGIWCGDCVRQGPVPARRGEPLHRPAVHRSRRPPRSDRTRAHQRRSTRSGDAVHGRGLRAGVGRGRPHPVLLPAHGGTEARRLVPRARSRPPPTPCLIHWWPIGWTSSNASTSCCD